MGHRTPSDFLGEQQALLALAPAGKVLDAACGDCSNGLFAAQVNAGLAPVCIDIADDSLNQARELALVLSRKTGISAQVHRHDIESDPEPCFPAREYSVILVFRFLHRPLFPLIRRALKPGGLLFYETFTRDQARLGKPKNPDHLLQTGELAHAFSNWETLYAYEGRLENPERYMSRLCARKPCA